AKKTKREVFIDIQEVHKPELDAQLVSESIALQLEKRVAFRRAMRKAVDSALRFGCKGIKVRVSGRLNGAEIARSEWYLQGQQPPTMATHEAPRPPRTGGPITPPLMPPSQPSWKQEPAAEPPAGDQKPEGKE